ncbi:hypothetical protein [Candidatus Pantoea floridensis]|uniref:Uncharacterized protein n=1 Tax=Candidatus Pantoea floridensis TaxID=1938870 RepID=A0A286DS64_9GAMM|nr:hypothetical protein [Pantoea floridensis]PIF06858.1 hypothetical protein BX596_5157 [Enterobacteriaceae bacterium JKS000233]SOD61489.1 hypothetical protein SAMN06273570_5160 [Pantoea floridensis]
MKRDTAIEFGLQKIKNAINQANQSGTHNVSVKLPEQEYKAVMQDICTELAKPDNHKMDE